jgi:hypothetical protein
MVDRDDPAGLRRAGIPYCIVCVDSLRCHPRESGDPGPRSACDYWIPRFRACETISNRIRSVPCPQGNWQGIFADPPLSGSPRPVLCNCRKDLRQIPCVEWAGNQAGYPVRIAGDFFGWQGFSKPRWNSSHALSRGMTTERLRRGEYRFRSAGIRAMPARPLALFHGFR